MQMKKHPLKPSCQACPVCLPWVPARAMAVLGMLLEPSTRWQEEKSFSSSPQSRSMRVAFPMMLCTVFQSLDGQLPSYSPTSCINNFSHGLHMSHSPWMCSVVNHAQTFAPDCWRLSHFMANISFHIYHTHLPLVLRSTSCCLTLRHLQRGTDAVSTARF